MSMWRLVEISGKVYKFECNAGGGKYGGVYKETNGQSGLQISGRNRDLRISISNSSYHACEETHQAMPRIHLLKIVIIVLWLIIWIKIQQMRFLWLYGEENSRTIFTVQLN